MRLSFYIILIVLTGACRKELGDPRKPQLPEHEEIVTTFLISFSDSASGTSVDYFFRDPDGHEGPEEGYFGSSDTAGLRSEITLNKESTYDCRIFLLNESEVPADTVSNSVLEESETHMLFFDTGKSRVINSAPHTVANDDLSLVITYLDTDKNGLPLGLYTRWRTGRVPHAGSPLKIILKHQDENKDGSFAPGETELEVAFTLTVE